MTPRIWHILRGIDKKIEPMELGFLDYSCFDDEIKLCNILELIIPTTTRYVIYQNKIPGDAPPLPLFVKISLRVLP